MADTGLKTIDGFTVTVGTKYWDYNLDACTVLAPGRQETVYIHGTETGDVVTWWKTDTGSFDGLRLWRRHPATGEVA